LACQGAIGYGERYGAVYADGFTDIMIGGVILPSLLHQNPRYFCLGTGTKSSRRFRTLSSSFVYREDNGRWQPSYSTAGGDPAVVPLQYLLSAVESRRWAILGNFLIDTGQWVAANLAQEVIRLRLTHKATNQN
jgi:hypothetical protein